MNAEIFVFGSNYRGAHGAGAAFTAVQKHGARSGCAEGIQGQSYAIPTKDKELKPLPLVLILHHVLTFLAFAAEHPGLRFNMTRIGCGLAGYQDADIAPMFAGASSNVILPAAWGGTGFDW